MKLLRAHHWWVTGALFAVALLLYLTGFSTSAAGIVFLGFAVETAAWLSFLSHPKKTEGGRE